MDQRAELSEFLKSRRARLLPEDVGLPPFGGRRRVPGLRREELAQLAGVSVDYYVRLEQGRNPHVSEAVLDAVARALRLDGTEHAHLRNLARPVNGRRRPVASPQAQRVPIGLLRMLDALDALPAYILGRCGDILAWNRLAAALLGDPGQLRPDQRNMARMVFLDDAARSLYVDWEYKAAGMVALLRFEAGRHPDDPRLAELVGELTIKSEDFRRLWAKQGVAQKIRGSMPFDHPVVGPLELTFETLRAPDDEDLMLVTYTAEPASEAEEALRLLGSWGTDPAAERGHESRDLRGDSRSLGS